MMAHLWQSWSVRFSTSPFLDCQLRACLRLFGRPLVVVLATLFAVTVVAAAELGQEYASRQQGVAFDARTLSCEELAAAGSTDACEHAQELQRQSRIKLLELAEEVGSPARSSQSTIGALSFVLGHSSTTVGLLYVVAVAGAVLGSERQSGLAEVRDTYMDRVASLQTRWIALMLTWLMGISVAFGALLAYNLWAVDARPISAAPDFRRGVEYLLDRSAATASVIIVVTLGLAVAATHVTRAVNLLAVGTALIGVLLLINWAWVLPVQAAWRLMQFRESESYLDHFPLFRSPPVNSKELLLTIVIVYTVGTLATVGLWGRRIRRSPCHGNRQ